MTVLEYFERRQAMKNGEGYPDPTAGQAIANAGKMPRHIKNIFRAGDNGAEGCQNRKEVQGVKEWYQMR